MSQEPQTGNVVDATAAIRDKLFVERFARLAGLVEQQEASVAADPKKFMAMAGRRIAALELQVRAAEEALSPLVVVRPYREDGMIERPIDPRDEALQRNSQARAILNRDPESFL